MSEKLTYFRAPAEFDFGEGVVWIEFGADSFATRQVAQVDEKWFWANLESSSSPLFFLSDQPISLADVAEYQIIDANSFNSVWEIASHAS
jgi:hypothetical protein